MISYNEKERVFKLDTPGTSYMIGIVDEENFVGHIYYGKKLKEAEAAYLMRTGEPPFVPGRNNRERCSFYDCFPFEYPSNGLGDFREGCISVRTADGHVGSVLSYVSHEIVQGKPALEGLPATFGTDEECETLRLVCEDKYINMQVELLYTVFEDTDVITRSVRVTNTGSAHFYLTRVYSACIDMDNRDYDMVSLHGSWARERHIQRKALGYGIQNVSSFRGESSHQDHPFLALVDRNTTQENGEIYAMNFVYSGNFRAQAEVSQFDSVRMTMGIHPENFCWKLESGESFQAPEVVMVYTDKGFDAMTGAFHKLYRKHLIRGAYKDKKRPILINNWEATYFEFDTQKLLSIAKEASKLGIEMLVMDDGWFGARSSDNCALGDWKVNEEKITGGLKYLVDEVNKLGMKFGIWFEPEMVSEDSDLYRAHPEWAMKIPGRPEVRSRNQIALDMSRKDVQDYLIKKVNAILDDANIYYVKWDINRSLADIWSNAMPAGKQGEVYHRYVLGLYRTMNAIIKTHPDILFEGCSGGGGRFDAAMLHYYPQYWVSDNNHPIDRLKLHYGTSFVYPPSCMGAHISDSGKLVPLKTKAVVAMGGTFGYELDATHLTAEEQKLCKEQSKLFRKYYHIIIKGDYYRLSNPFAIGNMTAWQHVTKDRQESLLSVVVTNLTCNGPQEYVRAKGLDADTIYSVNDGQYTLSGSALMNAGLPIPREIPDYTAFQFHMKAV